MKNLFLTKHKYSLLSLLLFLAVITFFVGSRPTKTNIAAREVFSAARIIRIAFADKGSYWGLSNNFLKSNNILTNFRYYDNQLVNVLGKPVLIGSGETAEVSMPGDKSFDVVYTDLSAKECIKLSSYRPEQSETLGLLRMTIVGNKTQVFEWSENANRLPVEQHKAKSICSEHSKVIWTFE